MTTRNTSAVRRLTTPSYHSKPKTRNSPTKLKRKSLLTALGIPSTMTKEGEKSETTSLENCRKVLSSLRTLSKAKW